MLLSEEAAVNAAESEQLRNLRQSTGRFEYKDHLLAKPADLLLPDKPLFIQQLHHGIPDFKLIQSGDLSYFQSITSIFTRSCCALL
jgi:hypothetical protein